MFDRATTLDALREGEIEIVGRIVGSSNNAMLVTVTRPCPDPGADRSSSTRSTSRRSASGRSTTSPTARWPAARSPPGTSPRRRGWGIVPPTILRDGPFGEGMVQAFVEADPDVDVVAMVVEDDPRLRRMAVLDAVMNNTDRKGGHILPVDGGRHVYGVDHGVCFSPVPKLRTVLWGWRGTPLDAGRDRGPRADPRRRSTASSARRSRELLSRVEVRATRRRRRRPAGRGPLPAPLPELAGHPLAAVLTVIPAAARRSRAEDRGPPTACGAASRPGGAPDGVSPGPPDRQALRAAFTTCELAKTSW